MIYYLKDDFYSSSGKTKYANKGDKIKVISDHDNVIIAENEEGNRFGCNKNLISQDFIEKEIILEKKNDSKNGKKNKTTRHR